MKQTIPKSISPKNDLLTLSIESLALGGKGVAHVNGFTILVDRALPDQIVSVQIVKQKQNYAEAKVIEIIKESPDRVSAPCPHTGICGGCVFQHLDYQKQLEYKRNQVIETLQHIGGFDQLNVEPTLACPAKFFYRNKMEFSFSDNRWLTQQEIQSADTIEHKNFALGLHVAGRYDKVLDVQQCFLLSEASNEILGVIKEWTKSSQALPYTTRDHTGFWRFLVIREGKNTRQTMINIVTADQSQYFEEVEKLTKLLTMNFPSITTIVHNINKKKAQIAFGDEERILLGPGFIIERLGGLNYCISANSFFQTNTKQAENLYNKVLEWGQFSTTDIVYDLYGGTGSITVYIANKVNRVVGFEIVPQAIEDAKQNCQLNNIDNCTFILGDLKEQLSTPQSLMDQYGKPTTIIIDPPRSGLHPSLPAKLIELSPEKIIYVSCNPATLTRDLKTLCELHYNLDKIKPIDMFPHTAHCEVVALMVRN